MKTRSLHIDDLFNCINKNQEITILLENGEDAEVTPKYIQEITNLEKDSSKYDGFSDNGIMTLEFFDQATFTLKAYTESFLNNKVMMRVILIKLKASTFYTLGC